MRVLEHVKLVDDVELNRTQLRDVICLLVFTLSWLVLALHQLRELLISHGTLPSANLTVVKCDQEASDRIER